MSRSEPLLDVRGLEVRHGLLTAVRGVDLRVGAGEVVALVGANGAGKSTLLRAVAGAQRPAAGRIRFEGVDVTALPSHRRVAAGISLVPEGRRLFPSLSVLENLLVGAVRRPTGGVGARWDVERVLEALPVLAGLKDRPAGLLSGGEQQATAIGRALVADPRLLLLDEVSLGLSPAAVDTVYASVDAVVRSGVTVVLVEQDLDRALATATRVVSMLEGQVTRDAPRAEVDRHALTQSYFGLDVGADTPGGTA